MHRATRHIPKHATATSATSKGCLKSKLRSHFLEATMQKVREEIITPAPLGSFGETDMNRNILSSSVIARE